LAFKTGLQGALYIDGTLINFITSLTLSIDRDTAEQAVMGQEYKIRRVGAYGVDMTGSALVDTASKQLLDEVLSVATSTSVFAIYPDRTDLTDYWYGTGQLASWSATGEPGGLWSGDFSGVIDQLTATGFTA
jgi:hypothetical protein